jgi:alanyl-tRNA synthetase
MTEKLFENDGFLLSFCATVLECTPYKDAYQVVLDKSAFAPNAGGQSADRGTLCGIEVLDVIEKDGILYHILPSALEVGRQVCGEIDEKTRLFHLQNHAGEHIISALLYQAYGFHNVGFHLGDKLVTLDTDGAIGLSSLYEIEARANEIVSQNRPILCYYPEKEALKSIDYRSKLDLEDHVRIVEIEGVDKCACCAPHPNSTGQIGVIKILSATPYKGGTRITMLCGQAALDLWNREREQAGELSHLLSLPRERLCEGVQALLTRQNELKARISAMGERELSRLQSRAQSTPQQHQVWFLDAPEEHHARKFGADLLSLTDGVCALVWQSGDVCRIIVQKASADHPFDVKALFTSLNVKGGGKGVLYQGSVACDLACLRTFFQTNSDWAYME